MPRPARPRRSRLGPRARRLRPARQRRVVSKAQILDRVWNYDFGGRSSVVELYISYLRKKIDAGLEPLIHTVRGVGYMIKAPQ